MHIVCSFTTGLPLLSQFKISGLGSNDTTVCTALCSTDSGLRPPRRRCIVDLLLGQKRRTSTEPAEHTRSQSPSGWPSRILKKSTTEYVKRPFTFAGEVVVRITNH